MTQTRTPIAQFDPFDTEVIDREVPPEIPRDQWGRPLIAPIGVSPADCVKIHPRSKRKEGVIYFEPYTRCSTLAKALDDQVNIEGWRSRNTALGVSLSNSLAAEFRSIGDVNARESRKQVEEAVENAMEVSGANERRRIGSAVHKFSEKWDKGIPIGEPGEYSDDLKAYVASTFGYRMVHIERFMVNDPRESAGTPDRVTEHPAWRKPRISDLKTGNDVLQYAQLSIAMQLANYAESEFYDCETGERTPFEVDPDVGVVWHLPAGEGVCKWYEVDLNMGREGIAEAQRIRNMRKVKGVFTLVEEVPNELVIHDLIDTVDSRPRMLDLRKLFLSDWQEEHNQHAIDRLAAIAGS